MVFDISYVAFCKKVKDLKPEMQRVPIAVLGDSATQYLCKALQAAGVEQQLSLDIYEGGYNQLQEELLQLNSPVYDASRQLVFLFLSQQKLYKKFLQTPVSDRESFAKDQLDYLKYLALLLQARSVATLLLCTYPEVSDEVFGSYATKHPASFLYQVRLLNYLLVQWAQQEPKLQLVDVAALTAQVGHWQASDHRLYAASDVVFALDFLPILARRVLKTIAATKGAVKKCVIVDLDNTMWGGIIGDDGLENIELGDIGNGKSFVALQHWIKELVRRGIIVAVCSKNNEDVAQEPFKKHPDMVLKMEDIAVFVANWENKADNIRYIQKVLNIGFDSMVFLDDNPFERNVVRIELPEITVPELPEDPVEYLPYLQRLNLFETIAFTEEDSERTSLYRAEAQRKDGMVQYTDYNAYLQSLEMMAEITGFTTQVVPRVAQLSQRSNQFNLRTVRYTQEQIAEIEHSPVYQGFSIRLADRFGDYGIIGVIIVRKMEQETLFIDTWIMSCRVLKRGVEDMCLNILVGYALANGFSKIIGEYLPTKKNGLVKDHYDRLGFKQLDNGCWQLSLIPFAPTPHFIQIENKIV